MNISDFSGCPHDDETPMSKDWLIFTEGEYYNRVRRIMIDSGMGQGDAEMILANVWEDGWMRGWVRGMLPSSKSNNTN